MRPYRPISDYALIGNLHGSALVARDGSIDWCCLERFDAEPVFSRLLDRRHGGFFQIGPVGEATAVRRAYRPGSMVLDTEFDTPTGSIRVTDFMVGSAAEGGRGLARLVTCLGGAVAVQVVYRPVDGFAEGFPTLAIASARIDCPGGPALSTPVPFGRENDAAAAIVTVRAGDTLPFRLVPAAMAMPADDLTALSDSLAAVHRGFAGRSTYDGPLHVEIERSALVLKTLTFAPTGAIVAAPTTSLPEEIGGVRNWDYRFCWLRDACLTFYAMKKFGSVRESEDFFRYLRERFSRSRDGKLKPLYSISGDDNPEEYVVEHYEGWRGSAPVRAGNKAADQHQLDVYGQVLDLLHLYNALGGTLDEELVRVGETIADYVAENWRDPDAGLWEPRIEEKRYTHAAIMNWVALDRACRLFGAREVWATERDAIAAAILSDGVHPRDGFLVQAFGEEEVDAAVLIAPMVGFPVPDDVMTRTVNAVIAHLGHGPLVYRYRTRDGLPGHEGTFLLCAFWLVDALAWLGREEEAKERFAALAAMANDVGLYPEEIAEDGTFLGNFPQAFSHLGFLHSALVLDLLATGGRAMVAGSYADRTRRETPRRRPTRVSSPSREPAA